MKQIKSKVLEKIDDMGIGITKKFTMHRPGFEPGSWAWKAHVIPLDYRCQVKWA
ncbi:MAG: hypothetical protein AEth_01887 [Candidatus Argoarchaeum ethanivorans]|uniref:Uncharacterized protein n=1 Tax=Candidatus Argoarchaeum ethanivorans TaxID=2608793 RepID=A0A8B3RY22_9EURY|nr:MAG: hypothetical protein AEth_01887 [Candidatus Argoarchaeum ethanivorans]